jgi:hypothetical protein
MTAVQVVIVVGVTFLVITAMVVVANRMIESERRTMQRIREEWIARGRIPEKRPTWELPTEKLRASNIGGSPEIYSRKSRSEVIGTTTS